jgi:glycine C-acetyltransferase
MTLVSNLDNYYRSVEQELRLLKSHNLYRSLNIDTSNQGSPRITHNKRHNILNFCSNDYLGISTHAEVVQATKRSIRQISPCSSRLITGNTCELEKLEAMLSTHRNTQAALVFPTGYLANVGTITVVADENCIIFSDELNHASIIDGCRLSRAKVKIFEHNNISNLEQQIRSVPGSLRKIVITEGIFSVDGDLANLKEICNICSSHDALLIVDDAHGDFIFGNSKDSSYSGVPSYYGVNSKIDFHVSSLSKALGCFGGYVAASKRMRELLINKSKQFIYTSSLPSHLCVSAATAIQLANRGYLQKRLFRNIDLFGRGLLKMGLITNQPRTQIIPILIGSERDAVHFSRLAMIKGILIQPIRFPTVKRGSSRVRISISSLHTKADLLLALDAVEYAALKMKLA